MSRRPSYQRARAHGWTAYEFWDDRITIKSDGELAPFGSFKASRPATKPEIAAEEGRRAKAKAVTDRIGAFHDRPEWKLADDIRSRIECMDVDNHPLDRLTLAEWQALRDRICGTPGGDHEQGTEKAVYP